MTPFMTIYYLGSDFRSMRDSVTTAIENEKSICLPKPEYTFIGLILRPEIGAIAMSGSSLVVALNALSLKRVKVKELI
jgi:Cu2+-exporting ATPase